jgi:hypothetical protein
MVSETLAPVQNQTPRAKGVKPYEKHRGREIAGVGARDDTPALDIRCAPCVWRGRDLQKDLFLAAVAANLSLRANSVQVWCLFGVYYWPAPGRQRRHPENLWNGSKHLQILCLSRMTSTLKHLRETLDSNLCLPAKLIQQFQLSCSTDCPAITRHAGLLRQYGNRRDGTRRRSAEAEDANLRARRGVELHRPTLACHRGIAVSQNE